jgi:hypothetical protein
MGLPMGLDKPNTGQAFLVGPSKPKPVDHWSIARFTSRSLDTVKMKVKPIPEGFKI